MSDTTDSTAGTSETLTLASQKLAWEILGPGMVGWLVQTLITGVCLEKSIQCFSSTSTLTRNMKLGLAVVLVLNVLVEINTFAEALMWISSQQRDEDGLYAFKVPDTYQPIIAGFVALVVQCFFADRAWRICNKNMTFFVVISGCILATLAGAIGLGVVQILNIGGTTSFTLLLIFTELWTWTTVLTDLIISVVIIFGLLSKKTGYDMPTDSLMLRIINAAMQSAALTTAFSASAAIIYAIQWNNASAAVDLAFMYPLPSIYTYSLLWCLTCTNEVRQVRASRGGRTRTSVFTMNPVDPPTGNGPAPNVSGAYSSALSSAIDTQDLLDEGILSPISPTNAGKDRWDFALSQYHTTLPPKAFENSPNDFVLFLKEKAQRGVREIREASESSQGSGSSELGA